MNESSGDVEQDPKSPLVRLASKPTSMVFEPRVLQTGPERFAIVGRRDTGGVVPWGFWGGVFALAAGITVIAYEGAAGLWSIWPVTLAIAAITVGLIAVRFGSRTSLQEVHIASVDTSTGILRLEDAQLDEPRPSIRLDEISEIVFGMTRYPVSDEKGAVKVHAYSLLVRHPSDALITIIEGSTDKEHVYGAARFLSQLTGASVTQVGLGVK